jgi:Protein of unknown function (DUF5672)
MNRAIILIISHKARLTNFESISLRQCVKILGQYPIRLICPQGLDVSEYQRHVPEIPIEFIDERWQSTYAMFNALKVSPFLYEKFCGFEYILFYEPDAFVFSDQLLYWCDRGLDYIGAPWLEGLGALASDRIIGVGNGGFSLRKVSSHLKFAKRFEVERLLLRGYREQLPEKIKYFCKSIEALFVGSKIPSYYMGPFRYHEDYFWSVRVAKRHPQFRIASIHDAISFSFEVNPQLLLQMNGNCLPFGCHGWFKRDLPFWKPLIEQFGYRLED